MIFSSTLTTPFTPSQINRYNGIKFALSSIDGVPASTKNILEINSFGDLNNNGIDDFIIRLTRASNTFNSSTPYYVIYGSLNQSPFPLDLNNLLAPSVGAGGLFAGGRGELLSPGVNRAGFVSQIADINGDRLKDFSVTTFLGRRDYVVFGKAGGLKPSEIFIDDPKTIDSTQGFRLSDGISSNTGTGSFRVLGDLNGDGIKDFKFDYQDGQTVIFGRSNGFPTQIDPNFVNGVNGFEIIGNVFDQDLLNAGDVNGDRRDDLIVKGKNGKSYLILSPANFPAMIDLNNFPADLGVVVNPRSSGSAISQLIAIGDLNKDGFDDLFLRSSDPSFLGNNRIIYGGNNLPASFSFNDSSIVAGTTLLENDRSVAEKVSPLGDINGDGIDDLVVDYFRSADLRGNPSSFSEVILGKTDGFGDRLDLFDQSITNNQFTLPFGAKNIGDFNGDKINDIYASNKILFGGRAIRDLSDAQVDGKNGIVVGTGLVPIGDINGDRRVDLAGQDFVIFGTDRINSNQVYFVQDVLNGKAYNHNEFPDGNYTNADRLNFSSVANAPAWVYGGTGNDTLAGHSGYIDQLTGGDGADTFGFNLEFGQQKGKGFGVVWDFVPGVDKVQVNGTANDYFFVEDSNTWLDNPSFLKKVIDTSATTNTILARRDADLGAVMIGAFSDVQLSISDLSFVPNSTLEPPLNFPIRFRP